MKTPPDIFHIPIEGSSVQDVLSHLDASAKPLWIVTANPEILLEARRDKTYAEVLQKADLRLVDGFGLWLMLRLFGYPTVRVTGVDLAERLLRWASERGQSVALIGGGKAETSARAMEYAKKKFPTLRIVAEHGGRVDREGRGDASEEEARHRLTLFAPGVLLVAFGHPKQERWIANHLKDFPSVKVIVGVGGAFDVWAGNVKRAPAVLRAFGLEWVWRVCVEPWRIGRIANAVIAFPILFLMDRLKK